MRACSELLKIIVIMIFLSACAQNYTIPDSTESSELRIFSDPETIGKDIVLIGVFTNEKCNPDGGGRVSYLYLKGSTNFGNKKEENIGMLDAEAIPLNSKYETKIPAGKPFTFILGKNRSGISSTGASMSVTNESCHITLSFIPEKDSQYEVKYFGGYSSCDGKIYRLNESPENREIIRQEFASKKLNCSYPGSW